MANKTPDVAVQKDTALTGRLTRFAPWVSLVARLVLGGALMYAGLIKLPNLKRSVGAVRAYELPLPDWAIEFIGYALPIGEVLLGAVIIAGIFTRWTALLGVALMVVFIIGIASAWIRGLNIDCGCFTEGGVLADDVKTKYLEDILRDIAFIACGVFVMIFPKSPIAVDKWIAGSDQEEN